MKKHNLLIAIAAIGALALAGCSSNSPTPESDQSAPAQETSNTSSSIDTMFGPVDLPEGDPHDWKVVALGWSDAEAALAVGIQPVAVYDWMGFGEEDKGVGPWATDLFGDETPEVFPNVDATVDYEAVAALEPDLILNVRSAGDAEQYERLSSIAPTVSGPEGTEPYAVDWRTHFTMIADALGQTDKSETSLAEAEGTISDLAQENPQLQGLTGVVGTKFGDAYGAYLPGDTRWDLLADLGFTLNPPVEELEAAGFYAPVSAEQISVFDADVAVFFPIGYTLEEMENDALLSSLAVVKDGRAVMFADTSEEAQAFSAMSVLSVPLAAKALTPQLTEAAALLVN